MCEFLLQRGANPNRVDKKGVSPYMQAFRAGRAKICDLLVDFGASEQGKKPKSKDDKKKKKKIERAEPSENGTADAPTERLPAAREQKRYVLSRYD